MSFKTASIARDIYIIYERRQSDGVVSGDQQSKLYITMREHKLFTKFILKRIGANDASHNQRLIILFGFLESHLFALDLQKGRIIKSHQKLQGRQGIKGQQDWRAVHSNIMLSMKSEFADIHFFLVAWGNLNKILKEVRKLLGENKDFVFIYKKHRKEIEELVKFRDHLEHITEGRLEGRGKKGAPLPNPSSLGNIWGDYYDFGGERFNLKKSFLLSDKIFRDINNWLDSLPDPMRPPVIE